MAYSKTALEKQALAAIEKHKLFFIEDIVSYLPCSRATFYNYNLDKLDSIKTALDKVKTDIKVSMRSKWYKSDAPVLQMALMKLICTDDERKKIAMNYENNEVTLKANISELKLPDFMK